MSQLSLEDVVASEADPEQLTRYANRNGMVTVEMAMGTERMAEMLMVMAVMGTGRLRGILARTVDPRSMTTLKLNFLNLSTIPKYNPITEGLHLLKEELDGVILNTFNSRITSPTPALGF